ncbi:MAG: multiheme c-type cytochrome [Myxococcota bacterium]|nr:multiheme c-type cytochrome [Myxococcota bacterium]
MKAIIPRWFMLCLACVCAACGSRSQSESRASDGPPRLLVVSSLIGYVEPCGCTVDLHLGGLARLAHLVEEERKQGPTAVVIVGPYLFEKQVDEHRVSQEKAKAKLLSETFAALGVDAFINTKNEMLFGQDFFDNLAIAKHPDPTVNVPGGQPQIVELAGLKIGLIGLVGSGTKTPSGAALEPKEPLKAAVTQLQRQGTDLIVAFAARPRTDLKRLAAEVTGIDFWFLSHKAKEEQNTQPIKGGYLVENGDRGRNIARLVFQNRKARGPWTDPKSDLNRRRQLIEGQIRMNQFTLMQTGEPSIRDRIQSQRTALSELKLEKPTGRYIDYTLIPVVKKTPRLRTIARRVDAYKASLKALNLASAGEVKAVQDGQSKYAGIAECEDCHPEAVEFWQKTKHAQAWGTLVKADKTFDAECVSCHVTGWQQPGGSVLGQTKNLESVQCEVCHGPGHIHAELGGEPTAIKLSVPKALCETCHNHHHSPKFNFDRYITRITGPGHELRKSKR